jgi:hypothetical protein
LRCRGIATTLGATGGEDSECLEPDQYENVSNLRAHPQEERNQYENDADLGSHSQEERDQYENDADLGAHPQEEINQYENDADLGAHPQEERDQYENDAELGAHFQEERGQYENDADLGAHHRREHLVLRPLPEVPSSEGEYTYIPTGAPSSRRGCIIKTILGCVFLALIVLGGITGLIIYNYNTPGTSIIHFYFLLLFFTQLFNVTFNVINHFRKLKKSRVRVYKQWPS